MKTHILALGFLGLGFAVLAAPALAQTPTIAPADAKTHVGQTVTVEGPVGSVYTARSGMTFIDIGGRYPDNAFAAVIFADDTGKFPDVRRSTARPWMSPARSVSTGASPRSS